MSLLSIMKVQDQAARNLLWMQQQEIEKLKAEIAELKQKQAPRMYRGFIIRGGEPRLENYFKNVR